MIIREELCIQQPADLMRSIMQRKTEIMLRPFPCTCLIKKQKRDHTTHFPLLSATRCDREGCIYRHGSKESLDPRVIRQSAPRTAPPHRLQYSSSREEEKHRKTEKLSRESWHHATDCLIAFLRRNEHSLNILGLNHRRNQKICFRAN